MAEKKSFLLRVSPAMWEELQRMAAEEFRSVNGQIEALLSEAMRARRRKIQDVDTARPPASEQGKPWPRSDE